MMNDMNDTKVIEKPNITQTIENVIVEKPKKKIIYINISK